MLYGLDDVGKLQPPDRASRSTERAPAHVERQKLERCSATARPRAAGARCCSRYFGEDRAEPCGNCDVCLEPPETFDGTEPAQKALSAVYRTGQRFGAGHLIDVLRGETNERIERLGHDRLSVFGIGKELDAGRLALGPAAAGGAGPASRSTSRGMAGCALAGDCRAVLKGEQRVALRRDPVAGAPGGQRQG